MYIKELHRELEGRMLDIWNGTSGLGAEKEEAYRRMWRQAANAKEGVQIKHRPTETRKPTEPRNDCNCKNG